MASKTESTQPAAIETSGERFDGALVPAIGAVIFASGEPVYAQELIHAFSDATREQIEDALSKLAEIYEHNEAGLRLEKIAGGYRITTRSEVGALVRQFYRQRNRTRLSPPALETLAIVAYRQPVTAPEVQAIRGKDPSAALRNLVDKRLIRIMGKKKVVGSPLLYGTTKQFLVHFGLNGLSDLPSIEEFDEFIGAFDGEGSDHPLATAAGESLTEEDIDVSDEALLRSGSEAGEPGEAEPGALERDDA